MTTKRSIEIRGAVVGLLIAAAYFAAIYGIQSISCMSPGGNDSVAVALALVTIVAVIAIGAVIVLGAGVSEPKSWLADNLESGDQFLKFLRVALAGLALLGVLWVALSAIFLPLCVPAPI